MVGFTRKEDCLEARAVARGFSRPEKTVDKNLAFFASPKTNTPDSRVSQHRQTKSTIGVHVGCNLVFHFVFSLSFTINDIFFWIHGLFGSVLGRLSDMFSWDDLMLLIDSNLSLCSKILVSVGRKSQTVCRSSQMLTDDHCQQGIPLCSWLVQTIPRHFRYT